MRVYATKITVACLLVLTTVSMLHAAPKKASQKVDPITRMNNRTPEQLMDLTIKTLAFVEKARKSPELAKQVAAMQKRLAVGKSDKAFMTQLAALRRRIILSHPSLDFETLMINKRPPTMYNHAQEQYVGRHSRAGDGLVLLKNWKNAPTETVLLAGKLPRGSVMHPDLSFDGKRVLFSYCDHTDNRREFRQHFIYEIGIDGRGLHRVTGNKNDKLERAEGRRSVLIEDFDPCYLPDGGFAFISTRCQSYGRCHGGRYTPSYMLYRGQLDGSDIRQLSFGEANEWDPSVMADGTATALYYGNYTGNPHMTAEPRSIPGSKKVMSLAVAHHSYSSGSVILVDRSKGDEGLKPLVRITPEVRFPETENSRDPGSYTNPWPLSEDLFLVSYMPDRLAYQYWIEKNRPDKTDFQRPNAYAIYLIDTLGGRELIYRDKNMSSVAPIPVRARKTPPVLPSFINTPEARASKTGVCYVQDVYQSTANIPAGEVKSLRVNQIFGQPVARPQRRGKDGELLAKKVLGTVPVNANGSAAFRVPAGIPLQLQALDKNGMCVMNMRSFIYLHPGEKLSCTGCHESRTSPPVAKPMGKIAICDLTPPPWKQTATKGFSFDKIVKPVLDRYCLKCHGLDPKKPKGEKNLNFCGPKSSAFALLKDKTLVFTKRKARSTYKDSLSHKGRFGLLMLKRQQGKNKLDPVSFTRLITWLDLSAQYYGDYSWNRVEDRKPSKEGEKALRAHIKTTFGETVSKAPYAALVNVADVDESRILKAPLAKSAGGWAQIAGGWKSADDKGYQAMKKLVIASIQPMAQHDIETTCNLPACRCGSCWVRTRENSPKWQFYTNNYSKDFKRIDPSGGK